MDACNDGRSARRKDNSLNDFAARLAVYVVAGIDFEQLETAPADAAAGRHEIPVTGFVGRAARALE